MSEQGVQAMTKEGDERQRKKPGEQYKIERIQDPDTQEYGVIIWLQTKNETYADVRINRVKEELSKLKRFW